MWLGWALLSAWLGWRLTQVKRELALLRYQTAIGGTSMTMLDEYGHRMPVRCANCHRLMP